MIKLKPILFACAAFTLYQSPVVAGTYAIYSNAETKNIKNDTVSTGTIDATYYRNLVVSYETRFNGAFLGYNGAYFRHYCNGSNYATNKVSTGNSFASNSDDLPCSLTDITVSFTGSGWWNSGPNEIRNIVVTGIKDAPTATSQSLSVNKNSNTGQVSLNVSDPQGAPMTPTVTSGPSHGSLTWSGLKFTYTPTACYSGSDSFQYYVKETIKNQTSPTTTVSITVNNVNFPPSINAVSSQRIPWHSPYSVALSGIAAGTCGGPSISISATSANASVFPNPTVSYSSPSASGAVIITPVTPPAVQSGTATVTLNLNDGVNTHSINFNTTVDWVSLIHR